MTNTPYIPKLRIGRTLGDAVKKATKPAFKKRSQMEHRLFTEWRDIVGDDLASKTLPEKLLKRQGGLWLQLRVHPAFALMLQHQEPLILERIGQFFGYQNIQRVTMRHDVNLASRTQRAAPSPFAPTTPDASKTLPALASETEKTLNSMAEKPLSDALRNLARHLPHD